MLERTFTVTEQRITWRRGEGAAVNVLATGIDGERLEVSMDRELAKMLPLGCRITVSARFEPEAEPQA